MSVINLLHTIPEFREFDYQLRSYGFNVNDVLANVDVTTVSIAALVIGLAVVAYSFFAKGGAAALLQPYGKSIDNSLDGSTGKAWHDTREFGFRSLDDNSTDISHKEVLDALADLASKWNTSDEDVTEAPAFES